MMKKNYERLSESLEAIFSDFKTRISLAEIPLDEHEKLVTEVLKDDKEKLALALYRVNEFKDTDALFREITHIKDILVDSICQLDDLMSNSEKTIPSLENKFGSRPRKSSPKFIKLIASGKIKYSTEIYGIFRAIRYSGYLSPQGYFEVNNAGKTKSFSSFTTAASFLLQKVAVKADDLWFAKDEDGNEHPITYYLKN